LLKVLPDSDTNKAGFVTEQSSLKSWFVDYAYNSSTGLFERGIGDSNQALDVNSWAILVFGPKNIGE